MKTSAWVKRKRMLFKSFYLRKADAERLNAAAEVAEISQAEFIRLALRREAQRVLRKAREMKEGTGEPPRAA